MDPSRTEGPSYGQPGLEVTSEHPGLEVTSAEHHYHRSNPEVWQGNDLTHKEALPVVSTYAQDNGQYVAAGEAPAQAYATRPRSRRCLWVTAGVIALVVIVAAVVGGVLGSRAAQGTSPAAEEPTPSATSPPASSVNTTTLRPNSRLAVTGRRDIANEDAFEARIIFQGDDDVIRMSMLTRDKGEWGSPIALEGLTAAKPGSPLAASMVLNRGQYEFFYVATTGQLVGATWRIGEKRASADSITAPNGIANVMLNNDDTKLASYWPYIVAQYGNGTIRKVAFNGGWSSDGPLNGNFGAERGSPLALVPTVTDMRQPDAAVGVLGRNDAGDLLNYGFGGNDTGSAWNTKPEQSIPLPSVAAIGAFAVARPGSTLTDTYVLYQDSDDEIRTIRLDGSSEEGWNTDSPKLGKADKGTDIACLTPQTGTGEAGVQVNLSDKRDMSRCYFMVEGSIKEVKLEDDGSWKELGFIPLE